MGSRFFALGSEVLPWIREHVGCESVELWVVLGLDGRPAGRAVADFGSRDLARHALQAFAGGRRLVCGSRDHWPYEPPWERLVLVRPLRHQERVLLRRPTVAGEASGPGLAPFPRGAAELEVLRRGRQRRDHRTPLEPMEGCIGTVKTFISNKGYGFIAFSEGEVFFHVNDCTGGHEPQEHDTVQFDVVFDPRRGKMRAGSVCKTAPRPLPHFQ